MLSRSADEKVASSTNAATTTDSQPLPASSFSDSTLLSPPPLPLDWTRVKRKRTNDEDCNCEDPLCSNMGRHRRPRAPLSSATVVVTPTTTTATSSQYTSYRGTAIVCLHEPNPDWFQGYFIPQQQQLTDDEDTTTTNNSNNPTTDSSPASSSCFLSSDTTTAWGLLGQQQEIGECLQCADGGYRELKVTVYPYSKNKKNVVISNVEWTGGDMMRLLQQEGRVRLEPQQLWTEQKAVPFCKRFFGGLLRRLQEQQDEDEGDNGKNRDDVRSQEKDQVLELIPDVAIIVGAMEVLLPKTGKGEDE